MSAPEVKVGDRVIVYPPAWLIARNMPLIEAEVTKAARVWLEIKEVSQASSLSRTWRMRRDTQDEGDRLYPQNNYRFFTPEQHAVKQRIRAARDFLREQGIRLENGSPWYGRETELAATLRKTLGLDE